MKIKGIIPTIINESVIEPWSSEKVIKFARRMLQEPKPEDAMQRLLQRAKGKRDDESTEEYMHRLRNMIRASEVLEELIRRGEKAVPSPQLKSLRIDPDTNELDPPLFRPRVSQMNIDDILNPDAKPRKPNILRPNFPRKN